MRGFTNFCGTLCAAMSLGAAAHAAPVQWDSASGGNGHWYDFVILDDGITTSAAEAAAESATFMGETGYLATITSAAEQAFLNTIWPGAGSVTGLFNDYSYFLIGASDRATEGAFEWIGGDEEGDALSYTNFKLGEPNNNNGSGGQEDYVVAWWEDSVSGLWNDVGESANIRAYLVEYDAPANMSPVPLPASLPMLVLALGGTVALRRKMTR
ncbi:MAG: lectin-like protein [Pseudomonadota bacterium]